MEIVSIDGKNFHKVTKSKGFTLSLEDAFLEKPQGGGDQTDPPPEFYGLTKITYFCCKFQTKLIDSQTNQID